MAPSSAAVWAKASRSDRIFGDARESEQVRRVRRGQRSPNRRSTKVHADICVSRARVSGRRRTPAATRAPKQALDELAAALANGSDRRRFLGGNVWRLLKISKSASIGQ
jgi:hypothetical protein